MMISTIFTTVNCVPACLTGDVDDNLPVTGRGTEISRSKRKKVCRKEKGGGKEDVEDVKS